MNTKIFRNDEELGKAASRCAARLIRSHIRSSGEANIVVATGTSQIETLAHLVSEKNIDWAKVRMFHLDEYIGLPSDHPASFRRYLVERFIKPVANFQEVHLIRGDAPDPEKECERIGELISQHTIDVALIGIGENGHIAFNDPPADFSTELPFIVVNLDEKCRLQQVGEGWFEDIGEVPVQAISMSVKRIMGSRSIIASVPEKRKASAVMAAVEGPVTRECPASVLQLHPRCTLFLDRDSASDLAEEENAHSGICRSADKRQLRG
jgi:glucosamine-6-phosphate deaminase